MERAEILEKIKEVIEPYAQNKEAYAEMNEETDLMADLQINSANLIDIILDAEDKFDIEIDNETMEGLYGLKDIIDAIQERINK